MENPIAVLIVVASIALTIWISFANRRHTRTTSAFYIADANITWKVNGLAGLGEYCSAASFLGVAGGIALVGVDGWWTALGFFSAWVVVLLVIAGPLKNAGLFTVGDALSARFGGDTGNIKGIRFVSMLATVALCGLYLVPQMVGAGHLFKLLLGMEYLPTVLTVGVLMAIYVIVGGIRGTTFNQMIQGIMLWTAMLALLIGVSVVYFNGNPFGIVAKATEVVPPQVLTEEVTTTLLDTGGSPEVMTGQAREMMPDAPSAMTPGVKLGDLQNQLSLVLALFLGTLGLPHILTRFYLVRNASEARKGAELTIQTLAVFYAMAFLVGIGAMYALYPTLVELLSAGEVGKATNMAVPILGDKLAGEVFLGIIAAGAMAAMLSTAAGLLIAAITSLGHDLYAGILRPKSSDKERLIFAKTSAGLLAVVSVLLAIWLKDENVAVLVAMCFGIAASTFAPALVFAVWWKRLTNHGVVAGISVGLVTSLVFTFAKFFELPELFGIPVLVNPALYSVPAAVLTTLVVSLMTKQTTEDVKRTDEFLALAHGS